MKYPVLLSLLLHRTFSQEAVHDPIPQTVEDQVCVTLEKYGDFECSGHAKRNNTFTALTRPGSPCKHTENMKDNSAKDQYCNLDKAVFHQTVFVHNKHCHASFAQKAISPMHLEYTAKKCTYGYKLKACTPGPCIGVLDDAELERESLVRALRSRV